jgi:hypothetical protein
VDILAVVILDAMNVDFRGKAVDNDLLQALRVNGRII